MKNRKGHGSNPRGMTAAQAYNIRMDEIFGRAKFFKALRDQEQEEALRSAIEQAAS